MYISCVNSELHQYKQLDELLSRINYVLEDAAFSLNFAQGW